MQAAFERFCPATPYRGPRLPGRFTAQRQDAPHGRDGWFGARTRYSRSCGDIGWRSRP